LRTAASTATESPTLDLDRPNGQRGSMPKMPGRPSVEVYIGQHGHVCIQQEDSEAPPGEWPTIVLEPNQVAIVARWLQEALPQASELFRPYEIEEDWSAEVKALRLVPPPET